MKLNAIKLALVLTFTALTSTANAAAGVDCEVYAAVAEAAQTVRQEVLKTTKTEMTPLTYSLLVDKAAGDDDELKKYFYAVTNLMFAFPTSASPDTVKEAALTVCLEYKRNKTFKNKSTI